MRTVFVNPSPSMSNPRRRKARKSRKARKAGKRRSRRNAGITSFVSNPMILSNPRRIAKRRKHARNPLAGLNLKSLLGKGLTYGGGAAVAVGANTLLLNGVTNFYMRNGARFAGAVAATMFMKGDLGAAAAGGMFYPMMQELAAKFLGGGTGVSGIEADLEGLAADLEDVMDDLDESDLSDDDMLYMESDEDDVLS